MRPTKQTVYLPVKEGESEMSVSYWERDTHITDVEQQEGYFFTQEELNQFLSDVIKDTLNTAAEIEELWGTKPSNHRAYVFINKRMKQILKEL